MGRRVLIARAAISAAAFAWAVRLAARAMRPGRRAVLPGRRVAQPIRRLSPYDVHCLRAESSDRPLHLGILATLEGRTLLDGVGGLRLADIRAELDARIAEVPDLRRVAYRPGLLAGGPIWIDDRAFCIDRHVSEAALAPPADEAAVSSLVEALMARPLDRAHPLWRIWFLTGAADGRLGVLVVLHHALADGLTAMRMVRALLGPPLPPAASRPSVAWLAPPPPSWAALVRDHLRTSAVSVLRLARPAAWRFLADVVRFGWHAFALGRQTPVSSLNAPVGPRRRLATLRLDQATVKRVARAHGCGVHDVVLSLVAGGVRALLDARGEPVRDLQPRAGVAVALFSPEHGRQAGNDIGTLHVPLPIAEADPAARIPFIAAARAAARQDPMVPVEPRLRAWLGRFGGFRRSLDHQRLVNLSVTYLPGPPSPIDILGARVLDLTPIAPLAGNLGLSFVAFSYAHRLGLTVRADRDRFPDLDALLAGMERDWAVLAASAALRPATDSATAVTAAHGATRGLAPGARDGAARGAAEPEAVAV